MRTPRNGLPLLGLLVSGCGLIHSAERDPKPPVELPEQFSMTIGTSSVAESRWWRAFRDPELDRLVDQVLVENFDFKRAYARLDQVQAVASGATALFFPDISVDAQASRTRSVFNPQIPANEFNQFSVSAAAAYEVDLWGRVYNTQRAAVMDVLAAKQDVEAIAISLTAQIAETWFSILEQRARKLLTLEQIRSNATYLELVELRFTQGLASGLDVLQQRQQLAASRTVLPQIEARLQVLEHQLAVLLGEAPTGVPFTSMAEVTIPAPPPLPIIGLPAAVVMQRPDVRAAQLRVVSADHRIGAAIADMFPALRLTGSVGTRAFEIKDLFADFIWNIAAGLTGPLFDGGRRLAEIDRTEAVLEEQLAAYGQAVIVAVREVEDALIQERKQRELLDDLEDQVELARVTLDEARSRYVNGLSDYLPVLTALRSLQTLEQQLVTAQRQLLSFRIQLYRALGGAWTEEIERPPALSSAEVAPPAKEQP